MAMLREAWNLGVINPEDANVPDARVLANSWSGLSRLVVYTPKCGGSGL